MEFYLLMGSGIMLFVMGVIFVILGVKIQDAESQAEPFVVPISDPSEINELRGEEPSINTAKDGDRPTLMPFPEVSTPLPETKGSSEISVEHEKKSKGADPSLKEKKDSKGSLIFDPFVDPKTLKNVESEPENISEVGEAQGASVKETLDPTEKEEKPKRSVLLPADLESAKKWMDQQSSVVDKKSESEVLNPAEPVSKEPLKDEPLAPRDSVDEHSKVGDDLSDIDQERPSLLEDALTETPSAPIPETNGGDASDVQAEIERLKQEKDELSRKLEDEKIKASQVEVVQKEKEVLSQQLEDEKAKVQNIDTLQQELEELKKKSADLEKAQEDLRTLLEEQERMKNEKEDEILKLKTELENQKPNQSLSEEEIADLKQKSEALDKAQAELKNSFLENEKVKEEKEETIRSLQAELDNRPQLDISPEELGDLKKKGEVLEKVQSELELVNQENQNLKKDIEDQNIKSQELKTSIDDLKHEYALSLSQEKSRIQSLEDEMKSFVTEKESLVKDYEELNHLKAENQSLKSMDDDNKTRIEELEEKLKNSADDVNSQQGQTEDMIIKLKQDNQALSDQMRISEDKVKDLQSNLEFIEKTNQQKLQEAESKIQQLQVQQDDLKNSATAGEDVTQRMSTLEDEKNKMLKMKVDLEDDYTKLKDYNQRLIDKEQGLQYELAKSKAQSLSLEKICQDFKVKIETMHQQIEKLKQDKPS